MSQGAIGLGAFGDESVLAACYFEHAQRGRFVFPNGNE
jgi:hypothetical protein